MREIVVYSSPGCSYCIRLKAFLEDNNVMYKNVDISEEPEKAQEIIAKTGQMGVPVTDIDGKIIVGFDQEKIRSALGL